MAVDYGACDQSREADMRLETNRRGRTALRPTLTATAALAVALIALSGLPARADDDESEGDFMSRMGASVSNSVGGVKKLFGLGKPPLPPQSASPSGCPEITVLDGTGAQRIMAANAAGNEGLRHQFSISDVARECRLSNNQMVLKVGVEGRVLLGPAGSPGTFDVPIRIAIVNKLDDKPFLSKLYKVAASIPKGQTGTPYTLVADSLVIPFGAGRSAQDYIIKIGIDGGRGGDVAAKPAHRRKAKPVAAASATQ
jgi:hypothetical protein